MQGKQIELLIIFKVNVLRNYKNAEERNDCSRFTGKDWRTYKGGNCKSIKRQVLKSREVAGRLHQWNGG